MNPMYVRRGRPPERVQGQVIACFLVLFLGAALAQPPGQGNRTVPQVEPPKTTLEFSAEPTPQEFFRARLFEEPLVPMGGEPTAAENKDLAAALLGYSRRRGPNDFSSLTAFLETHPGSPWAAALLTDLGLEYYHTAHYSLALDAWSKAWALAKDATERKARVLADRAFGELICMNSRLGRMDEMAALLQSITNRSITGPAAQRVVNARDALWTMQHRPEVAFRCGPLAVRSLRLALNLPGSTDTAIWSSASTQKGCSLTQVSELSRQVGLNYQMVFREQGGEFVVPSIVHWKVGHYAAMVRKEGNLYYLQDPTFGNTTWATKEALQAETSGYFLVPPGPLPKGWRGVAESEGATIWGKGQTAGNQPGHTGKNDYYTPGCPPLGPGTAMAVASIHLMEVSLNVSDQPVGYTPPVGPEVRLSVRYNQRDIFQPANFNYVNFGSQWTCDWISYITDTPTNLQADVTLYLPGGGQRTFTGFDTNTQTFAYQKYDQTLLKRTGPNSYELLYGDGSKLIFSQSDGSIGSTRKIFMTEMEDPQGNAVTLIFDADLRIVAVTDAIGQVTTISYGPPSTSNRISRVTDPFGRFATFTYDDQDRLVSITDSIGLTSQIVYNDIIVNGPGGPVTLLSSFIKTVTTPYGNTQFFSADGGNARQLTIRYPDGSFEIVEYNQTNNIPQSDPPATVPTGMMTVNNFLPYRNTYYWDRTALAQTLGGHSDYSKARLFHWLHAEDGATTSGALESIKQPLENRVWYDYTGQADSAFGSVFITSNTLPAHMGRVLDDGSTQLYTYEHNPFGHITNSIDPVGRTMSYIYDTNGIDLLEVRQTRATNNELLVKFTYNSHHRPLTITDAAGQTTTLTYNPRGQVLTTTNPKHETVTFTYDANGYLVAIDGPLPGTNDVVSSSYDAVGRVRSITTVSGYTLTFDYDNLDRVTRTTYPDGTFNQYTYDRLDLATFQDRAGRQTIFAHDGMRRLVKQTDPLGRATRLEWCRCGALKSLTDAMGRTTSWLTDVQARKIAKQYPDGSQVRYFYENTTSRLRQVVDEKQQSTFYAYNPDDTLRAIVYANAAVPTPAITFTYDPNYRRLASMSDGTGTTTYNYNPVSTPPALGAGHLASVDGPSPNDTTAYAYDELGRAVQLSINGVASTVALDPAGRITSETNALGGFAYGYDGASGRVVSETFPNGQTGAMIYGSTAQDFALQQVAFSVGNTPISLFGYGHDTPRGRITSWSQQAGSQPTSLFTFGYDAADQLVSATVTNLGVEINSFAYNYDPAGNRLREQAGANSFAASYNTLNEISTTSAPGSTRTNEWDAAHRLVAVSSGNRRTEFTYDGHGRRVAIRQLVNGSEISRRRFVWSGLALREERDGGGAVTKRYFDQGMKVETGPNAGSYFYTSDHLGSIREMTDSGGTVRARYSYDPWGRRTRLAGDLDADFGFAGMFWSPEANLSLTHFRAYDPELGRWLSRDPLRNAEVLQGPNLFAYAANNPVNRTDPTGLDRWTPEFMESLKARLTPEQYEMVLAKKEGRAPNPFGDSSPPPEATEQPVIEQPGGDVEVAANEVEDPGGEVAELGEEEAIPVEVEETVEVEVTVPVEETTQNLVERAPRIPRAVKPLGFPGLTGVGNEFIGAGITILTMTDCNTAEGIFALVRQGKGGMANKYADRLMKQISPYL